MRKPTATGEQRPNREARIVTRDEFRQTLPLLTGPPLARWETIWRRVGQIRKRLNLNDMDTARLLKRFFDDPRGVGQWAQAQALGLMNRHMNRRAGDRYDMNRDPHYQELHATDARRSGFDLDATERLLKDGVSLNDLEDMLADLYSFTKPVWTEHSREDLVAKLSGAK